MIFGRTKLELKLGFFVFIALVIFAIFILSVGGIRTWSSGYQVSFMFNFINGVKKGAPVRFAGVDVGEVTNIKYFYEAKEEKTKIRITCWVPNEVMIPRDSTVVVNTLGLLGEKYIEILPGVDYKNVLQPNETIDGEDPLPMNEVFKIAKNIVESLDTAINKIINQEGTIGKILYDDTLYRQIEGLIVDLRKNPWKLFWKTKEKK